MKLKDLYLALTAIAALVSCQSQPDLPPFTERLQSWQGASFNELVQAWGLPLRQSFETDTGYAEWQSSQIKKGPSISIGLGGFGDHVRGSIGTTIHGKPTETSCTIQVLFDTQQKAFQLTSKGPEKLCGPIVPERHH